MPLRNVFRVMKLGESVPEKRDKRFTANGCGAEVVSLLECPETPCTRYGFPSGP
jgi:hypothetical protein